ncbi:MAG: DUF2490 domain-containing protein [Cytophagales bacterium]|nr:DUF2490 domain-containing protein [Cytophagales bacterium]
MQVGGLHIYFIVTALIIRIIISSFFISLILLPDCIQAQDKRANYEQLWLNFMLHKTFNNGLRYLMEVGPRTLLGQESGWSQFELAQNVQYNVFWNIDAVGGLLFNYTNQTDTTDLYDSYEIRPWIGTRIHFNPNAKLMVSFFGRYEQRFLYYTNASAEEKSGRIRNRLEFTYSINHRDFYQDRLWYVTLDGEMYVPTNEKFGERFANAVRIRAGLGYRHSFNWRFVILFMEQFSRNTIDEGFKSSNFIVDLRTHFFIPAKSGK